MGEILYDLTVLNIFLGFLHCLIALRKQLVVDVRGYL